MSLSQDEQYSLKYLDFNPRVCLIFEDCGAQISSWGNNDVVQNFFFYGRWFHITVLYTFHDDTLLAAPLRKNAHICVFTNSESAYAFFGRGTNGISGPAKKVASRVIDKIFDPPGPPNFKKLVYLRGDNKPWCYAIADLHEQKSYQFGSPSYKAFADRTPLQENGGIDNNNPFLTTFRDRLHIS